MSERKDVLLGEVARVEWGDTSKTKAAYVDSGVRAYSASGPDGWLPEAHHDGDGVVISAIGAQCGKTWFASGEWSCIKNTLWFQPLAGTDARYLYYATSGPGVWPRRGAAQPFISLGDARSIPLRLPPKEEQRRVGHLLGGYDELIENNTRRIQILEEMAQAIYREWFVEFRYPGHEDVPLVDSDLGPIPEGWESVSFAGLGDYLNGFAFKPSHWGDSGLPIVKIKELKAGVNQDTPRYLGADVPQKYLIGDGNLLFSWSAHLDAYIWSGGDAWLNQHLFLVTPNDDVPTLFLFHALRDRMGEFRARSQGTTMKHIKRAALSEVRVAVPAGGLPAAFETHVAPLDSLRLNLVAANANLRTTRDLLLPRLISGEIDVSDLDIDVGDAAA